MIERFLFHRVGLRRYYIPVDKRIELSIYVLPYPAYAELRRGNSALMGAQIAMHPIVFQFFIQHCFFLHCTKSAFNVYLNMDIYFFSIFFRECAILSSFNITSAVNTLLLYIYFVGSFSNFFLHSSAQK